MTSVASSAAERAAATAANEAKELLELEVTRQKYQTTPPRTVEEVYEHLRADLRYWELTLRRASANQALGAMAHSRPALAVHAPAFFRHAMYFFPQSGDERNPLMHQGDFRRVHALKDIHDILIKLAGNASKAGFSKEIQYRFDRDESFVYALEGILGFELRAVVDVYSEYATVSLVLDKSERFSSEEFRSSPEAIAEEIQRAITKRKAEIQFRPAAKEGWPPSEDGNEKQGPPSEGGREKQGPPSEGGREKQGPPFEEEYSSSAACFFGIWELLNSERGTRLSSIGKMVADFRGFALVPEGYLVDYSDNPKKATKNIKTNREDDDRYQIVPHPPQKEQNVFAFLESKRPFFLECLGLSTSGELLYESHGKDKGLEPNVILCRMLGGDAIYGSSLGSPLTFRPRKVPRPHAPVPVAYFVIHNGQSANQLGRMIRRQNLLGELRIAALLDADLIVKLGSAVRRLSGLLTTLLEDCTKGSFVNEKRFREILEIYAAVGRSCHGGFNYRMSRANYYYEALQERLKDTRSKPILGWQSYSGFINRHFDQRFRSMRSVGERYEEVGGRIQQLFTLYGTETRHRSALVAISISTAAVSFSIASTIDRWVQAHLQSDRVTDSIRWMVEGVIYLFVMSPIIALAIYFYLHPPRHLRANLHVKARWYHWFLFGLTVAALAIAAQYGDLGEKLRSAWGALSALVAR